MFINKELLWLRLVIQLLSKAADTEWKVHEELLAKARKMLAWPLCENVVSKDGLTTIIKLVAGV